MTITLKKKISLLPKDSAPMELSGNSTALGTKSKYSVPRLTAGDYGRGSHRG